MALPTNKLQPIRDRILLAKRATRDDIQEALDIARGELLNPEVAITALVEGVYSQAQLKKLLSSINTYD